MRQTPSERAPGYPQTPNQGRACVRRPSTTPQPPPAASPENNTPFYAPQVAHKSGGPKHETVTPPTGAAKPSVAHETVTPPLAKKEVPLETVTPPKGAGAAAAASGPPPEKKSSNLMIGAVLVGAVAASYYVTIHKMKDQVLGHTCVYVCVCVFAFVGGHVFHVCCIVLLLYCSGVWDKV